ncbi:MAG: NPCBM/NEW2 domain-containing protein [Eubacteriales bacterium]|nr:NPCBM/NEW2 domain-containing protein [Eubacteriales bacterium]
MKRLKRTGETFLFFCALMLLCAMTPVKANASAHNMEPYETWVTKKIYVGDQEASFSMKGVPYYYGVTRDEWYNNTTYIVYNLDQKASSVSFLVGHVDGGGTRSNELKVYVDQELVKTMELTGTMSTQSVTIPTAGKKQIYFRISHKAGTAYARSSYAIANVRAEGLHRFESEMTKSVSVVEDGTYTHTCTECGYSYQETIPKQTYCDVYLAPYQNGGFESYTEKPGSEAHFDVMGKSYYNGLSGKGDALYNLNKEYKSVTFTVGHVDGTSGEESSTLTVYCDGNKMKSVDLSDLMINQTVTVNTEGVSQLKLSISKSNYAIFKMSGVKYDNSPKAHSFEDEVLLEAELGKMGLVRHTCTDCGATYTETTPALTYPLSKAVITLSSKTMAYTGKARKPSVTVTVNGTKLTKNIDYTLTYANNVKVGTATVTVKGKGNYTGHRTITYKIAIDTKKTYTSGNLKYKITSTGKKTAQVVGMVNAGKTSVTIPSTVKILGTNYKVTAVAAKAFYKKTSVKTMVVGANVQTIGKQAFYGCSRLNKITVKTTKLESVGTNALKGIKKNARIYVPRRKYTAYKKLFNKKGQTVIFVKS